jgi:hypothetical protein
MNRTDAIDLFTTILNTSMEFRLTRGELPMSFLLVMPNGDLIQIPPVVDDDKDVMVALVRNLAKQMGARYVLSVGEAWVSARNQVEGVRPSEDPARMEALIVSIDGPDLERLALVEIRPDGTLGEPNIQDVFSGRLANLSGGVSETVN